MLIDETVGGTRHMGFKQQESLHSGVCLADLTVTISLFQLPQGTDMSVAQLLAT